MKTADDIERMTHKERLGLLSKALTRDPQTCVLLAEKILRLNKIERADFYGVMCMVHERQQNKGL